jgi:hypothetical protein
MTRFDEVDDPANIGDEQERIQEAKLKELTLKQLEPGATQSIARLRDEQQRPQDTYTPAGGGTLNGPGILRRGVAGIANYYGSIRQRRNEQPPAAPATPALENYQLGLGPYTVQDDEPVTMGPISLLFQRNADTDAAEEEIRARKEQEDHDRMEWFDRSRAAAWHQADESLNIPSSTANYYIGDHESPKSSAGASSSAAASSSGGWDRIARAKAERLAAERLVQYNRNTRGGMSLGSSAVDASHHAALESMRKKSKVMAQVGMSAGSSAVDAAHEASIARMRRGP